MSKGKIIISVIICIAIVGAVGAATVLHIKQDSGNNYDKTIVYIGDSLCEALLGSSPLSERDSYGFYAVTGRRNNYRYIDSSVSGDTAKGLYNKITGEDTASQVRQYWLAQADIIYISILGNDFLSGSLSQTMHELIDNDYTRVGAMKANAEHYFALCIERVKQLNPSATIILNTLYNPIDEGTNIITEQEKADLIAYAGGEASALRTEGDKLLQCLNSVIYDYLEEHPAAFEVIDAYTAFEEIYNDSYADGVALFYGDWLHPSNEGHAVIADLLQDKLEALGLAKAKLALSKYKKLRLEQLSRLYSKTEVDIISTKLAILTASSCKEVTKSYFSAVRGTLPIYTPVKVQKPKGEIFATTQTFSLSSLEADGTDYGSFLDKEQSYFTFRKDGTFSVYLKPLELALAAANLFLSTQGALYLGDGLGPGNFATDIEVYIKNIWPGFDFRELKKDLELISSCGIYVHGLDFDSKEVQQLETSLREDITVPKGFKIPLNLALEIKGYYYIQREGDFTLLQMQVGNVSPLGSPFLYAVLHTEGDSEWVELFIEVPKVRVTGEK